MGFALALGVRARGRRYLSLCVPMCALLVGFSFRERCVMVWRSYGVVTITKAKMGVFMAFPRPLLDCRVLGLGVGLGLGGMRAAGLGRVLR